MEFFCDECGLFCAHSFHLFLGPPLRKQMVLCIFICFSTILNSLDIFYIFWGIYLLFMHCFCPLENRLKFNWNFFYSRHDFRIHCIFQMEWRKRRKNRHAIDSMQYVLGMFDCSNGFQKCFEKKQRINSWQQN